MSAPDLKPCPFCGETEDLNAVDIAGTGDFVYCQNCHAEGPDPDSGKNWNTRDTSLAEALVVVEMGGGDVLALVDFDQYEAPLSRQEVYANGWNAALRAIGEPRNG